MSRTLSSTAISALYAQETGEVFVVLLTISHEALTQPIYVCSDAVNTVSRGITFISFPFELQLPDSTGEGPSVARLTIDNVSEEIESNLRKITSPPSVTIEIVRAAEPDLVETSFPGFILANVKADAAQVQADLVMEDLSIEPFPSDNFVPSLFPGLF